MNEVIIKGVFNLIVSFVYVFGFGRILLPFFKDFRESAKEIERHNQLIEESDETLEGLHKILIEQMHQVKEEIQKGKE